MYHPKAQRSTGAQSGTDNIVYLAGYILEPHIAAATANPRSSALYYSHHPQR
jgi:hypothetical protein